MSSFKLIINLLTNNVDEKLVPSDKEINGNIYKNDKNNNENAIKFTLDLK